MELLVETWLERADAYLYQQYEVTIEDAGYAADEFVARWMDQGRTPEEAIEAFAEKYDLQRRERFE